MLSMIFTGLGLLLKLSGAVEWAEKMFELANARKQGMVEQKAADDAASVTAAQASAKAQADTAGMSDAAVTAALEKDVQK